MSFIRGWSLCIFLALASQEEYPVEIVSEVEAVQMALVSMWCLEKMPVVVSWERECLMPLVPEKEV